MKSDLAKVSLALLSAVFILGCQDVGTGPVGPDGLVPQFDKKDFTPKRCEGGVDPADGHCHGDDAGDPVVDPGTLFISGPIGAGVDCRDGATKTDGSSKGTVNFNQPRDDSHMHANVQLRGAPEGKYEIFGNQEIVCLVDPPNNVDFDLRPGHDQFVTVGANGKGKARIGLDFGGRPAPEPKIGAPASHAEGSHNLWLTLVGIDGAAFEQKVVLRSTAITVVIPFHDGH